METLGGASGKTDFPLITEVKVRSGLTKRILRAGLIKAPSWAFRTVHLIHIITHTVPISR